MRWKNFALSYEIRWLGQQAKPLSGLLIANFVCIVVAGALTVADPLVMKWLIDVAIRQRSPRLVLAGTGAFCAIYLAGVGTSYLAGLMSAIVTQKMAFRIRVSLLRCMHTLPGQYYNDGQVGEMLYRLEQDVDRVVEVSGDMIPLTMHMVIVGLMVLVTMALLNWRLTSIVLPLLPAFYFIHRRFAARLKLAADNAQAQAGRISAFLQEHLAGMLQLQLLNRTGLQGRSFARLAAEGAKIQIRQRVTEMTFAGASVSLIVLGMSLILGFGGYEVARGTLTVGGLVAFYGYVTRLFEPVSIGIDLQARFQRVGASIRRLLEISNRKQSLPVPRSRTVLAPDSTPDLEFRSVWFSYSDRSALRGVSFRVNAGEKVALVGLNGSGKSTVGLLATRLQVPDAGTILVGGLDIQDISRWSLRSTVTLVPQEPVLFDETVRNNLLYGNPAATNTDLESVAAYTQLDEVLRKLPLGFDEPLGPLASRLSGGEKKRLALARTLLQQPRILILDEVTSALDAPTTVNLLRGLELFRTARTLIVISHRPETILWADRILVIDQGRVVDSGAHHELISRCQIYGTIWQAQHETSEIVTP